MCVFLFACGEPGSKIIAEEEISPSITVEEEIIGKWIYYTGFTTWSFVFNEV